MIQFAVRAALSGILIALVALTARRNPALGALIVSLPLVSLMGMLWLWHDTHDRDRMAAHVEATFWYVLPSLPMFLAIPGRCGRASVSGLPCSAAVCLRSCCIWPPFPSPPTSE